MAGTAMRAAMVPLLLLLAVTGCAQAPVPEPFPQEVADAWVVRYTANDAAGIAALYTEDAQLLPPDLEIVSGRAAIQEFFARTNPPGSAGIEIATVETHVFGDYAHRQGSFLLKGPDGGTVRAGKFLELWKKVDGRWLIHRDMWSANAPAPATAMPDEPA
ncbi:MAG: DUF4440 domain-containing protein [Steroidobacteraceae bacterium]